MPTTTRGSADERQRGTRRLAQVGPLFQEQSLISACARYPEMTRTFTCCLVPVACDSETRESGETKPGQLSMRIIMTFSLTRKYRCHHENSMRLFHDDSSYRSEASIAYALPLLD
jgi:hypothetical protein